MAGGRPGLRLHPGHLPPGRDHRWSSGIGETGKTTVYVRAGQPEITAPGRSKARDPASSSRSRPAAPTSAARCASSRPRATSSAPATAASTASWASVIGGPPVRPLDRFQTRVTNGQVEIGPRYSVTTASIRFAPATPASSPAGSGSTSTRRGPRRRRRPEHAEVPNPEPLSRPAPAGRADRTAPGRRERGRPPAEIAKEAGDRRRRLGRRAHRRNELPHRGCSSGRCRRAPTGSTRSAPRPSSPSCPGPHGRVPGDVLHAVADRAYGIDHPPHQRRLARRVRPRHAQVGRLGDDHPASSCTWRAPSSSAPTSTRGSSTG